MVFVNTMQQLFPYFIPLVLTKSITTNDICPEAYWYGRSQWLSQWKLKPFEHSASFQGICGEICAYAVRKQELQLPAIMDLLTHISGVQP